MKRLHVHLVVDDLARSIDFYAALFGAAPTLVKHDYAKWQVDDPRVNFTVSKRAREAGLDHLGIQVEEAAELAEIAGRLAGFGAELVKQKDARCCYARSDKAWANDPQGIAWETFLTHGEAVASNDAASCCGTMSCGSGRAETGQDAACCA